MEKKKTKKNTAGLLSGCCCTCATWVPFIVWHALMFHKPIWHFPSSLNFHDRDVLKVFNDKSARGDHTQEGCLSHCLCTSEMHCYWQPTAALHVTTSPLKVSVCPQRRRALNSEGTVQRQETADECREKRFKCQQTVFLTCWEECGPL